MEKLMLMPSTQPFSGNATSFMFSILIIEDFLSKQIFFWFFFCGFSAILSVQIHEKTKFIIYDEKSGNNHVKNNVYFRLIITHNLDINTTAVEAAYTVKRYSKQAQDGISLNSLNTSNSFLSFGTFKFLRNFVFKFRQILKTG
jgi:hypothetical protein